MEGQRLDKWLYCARLAKTRTGAARLIEDGRVRINSVRALKPSRLVQAGDVVTATPLGRVRVVRVVAAAEEGGPTSHSAILARALYEDLTPQMAPAQAGDRRKGRRPTKRNRRRIDVLRRGA